MGKKNKKIFREQYEEPVDVSVFDDDAALDALIKDYLNEESCKGQCSFENNEEECRNEARNTMSRILSRVSKPKSEQNPKTTSNQERREYSSYNSLSLQPTLGISKFLDRVVLTDKTGVTTYASTNKYPKHTCSEESEAYGPDQLGQIISEFEYLLLVDSTPSAVFYYKEFLEEFKTVVKTNRRRFLFFIDDDFNYADNDRVYCFFNGTSFYNSCSDVIDQLGKMGYNNEVIVDILRDLVIYHGQTSFIGRDAHYEFDAFHDSSYNSKDKIIELIKSDRLVETVDSFEVGDSYDPDLADIFNFKKFSEIEYRTFSPFQELEMSVIGLGEAGGEMAKVVADELGATPTLINSNNEETDYTEEDEVGATNDDDPFHSEPEDDDDSEISDGVRVSGGDGYRDVDEQQEIQEETEEENGEGGDTGVIDADPETFEFEEEEKEEDGPSEPAVKKPSDGSMVLPVFTA